MIVHSRAGVLAHRRLLFRLALLKFLGWPSADSLTWLLERSNKLAIVDDSPFVSAVADLATRLVLKVRMEER